MAYEVSLAKESELERLPAIEFAAEALFSPEDLPESMRGKARPVSFFETGFFEKLLWVARLDGYPVGFILARALPESLHIEEMDVHPDHGRRGLGGRFVAKVREEAKERMLEKVTLTTFSHIPWNAPFYEKLDFRRLSDEELSPALSEILEQEYRLGLQHRVAMELSLETESK